MTNKFKIGDKVQYILDFDICGMTTGMIFIIETFNDKTGLLKLVDNDRGHWNPNAFKLVESAPVNKPRVHADIIKAWADGVEIEYLSTREIWVETKNPVWGEETKYRIKPKPITLEVSNSLNMIGLKDVKVKFTFDGYTKEAISVELIKE